MTVIEARHVGFRWSPATPEILRIERLDIVQGEHVFIKGPSGTGKTTLLNLLGGIMTPQTGEITLLGDTVSKFGGRARDRFRADHIGVIFQMFNLVPYLSVLDNVMLPCRFSMRRRQRAIAQSGSLEADSRRLLAHLELSDPALLARPVTQLSQGQQQRVAAARALIGGPEIILADEPTSALDLDVRARFLDLLFSEAGKAAATIVFVSHDNTLEDMFSRTIALDEVNAAAAKRKKEAA